MRKVEGQLDILDRALREHPKWTKKIREDLSKATGLSEVKVQKWFWDKKSKKMPTHLEPIRSEFKRYSSKSTKEPSTLRSYRSPKSICEENDCTQTAIFQSLSDATRKLILCLQHGKDRKGFRRQLSQTCVVCHRHGHWKQFGKRGWQCNYHRSDDMENTLGCH